MRGIVRMLEDLRTFWLSVLLARPSQLQRDVEVAQTYLRFLPACIPHSSPFALLVS